MILRAFVVITPPSSSLVFPHQAKAFAFHHRPTVTTISTTRTTTSLVMSSSDIDRYTIADQPARYARAKKENNQRYLDIESVYDPSFLKGLRVAVTGANRGIGLALAKELTDSGGNVIAIVRSSSNELEALKPAEIVQGIDVTNDEQCANLASQIKGGPIDIVSFVYNYVVKMK